ncbi:MAG: hypothetical protein ACKVJK_15645 [Methylophagaceae bacterium]|jgi:hypothetical protein|tara:strand:+ start:241 stop:741 length:501 start_codon:yes stop_codon:yes gene_type:complete
MRLIKAQSTSVRNIKANGIRYDINQIVQLGGEQAVVVPMGNTASRPLFPANGMIRYNTETEAHESYANGTWARLKRQEPVSIVQQNLGVGDGSELDFGPLANGDADFPVPTAAQNVLVLVESVFQISGTNYSLAQNPASKQAGWYIRFSSAPPVGKPVTVLHNFDK